MFGIVCYKKWYTRLNYTVSNVGDKKKYFSTGWDYTHTTRPPALPSLKVIPVVPILLPFLGFFFFFIFSLSIEVPIERKRRRVTSRWRENPLRETRWKEGTDLWNVGSHVRFDRCGTFWNLSVTLRKVDNTRCELPLYQTFVQRKESTTRLYLWTTSARDHIR